MKPTQLCGFLLCASACSRERRSRCNAPICGRIARSAAFVRLSCAVSRKFSSWCADITHTHRRAASPQCIFCLAVHCIIVHFPDLPHYLFTAPSRENFFLHTPHVYPFHLLATQPVVQPIAQRPALQRAVHPPPKFVSDFLCSQLRNPAVEWIQIRFACLFPVVSDS